MTQLNQINPYVVLAAILFNLNKTKKVMIKPDDASPEIEVELGCVGVQTEEDIATVCVFPMEEFIKFQSIPYDFSMRVDNGHVIISFEKHYKKTALFTANGEAIATKSPVIERLLTKLSGGEIVSDKIQNP